MENSGLRIKKKSIGTSRVMNQLRQTLALLLIQISLGESGHGCLTYETGYRDLS